jgi:hypothetical protein
VNASFTAAIVVRSLWAAERSSWLAGVLAGCVIARRELVWPVSVDVVVAVDIFLSVFRGMRTAFVEASVGRRSLRRGISFF